MSPAPPSLMRHVARLDQPRAVGREHVVGAAHHDRRAREQPGGHGGGGRDLAHDLAGAPHGQERRARSARSPRCTASMGLQVEGVEADSRAPSCARRGARPRGAGPASRRSRRSPSPRPRPGARGAPATAPRARPTAGRGPSRSGGAGRGRESASRSSRISRDRARVVLEHGPAQRPALGVDGQERRDHARSPPPPRRRPRAIPASARRRGTRSHTASHQSSANASAHPGWGLCRATVARAARDDARARARAGRP